MVRKSQSDIMGNIEGVGAKGVFACWVRKTVADTNARLEIVAAFGSWAETVRTPFSPTPSTYKINNNSTNNTTNSKNINNSNNNSSNNNTTTNTLKIIRSPEIWGAPHFGVIVADQVQLEA